eukprot:TRINITY_DN4049_c0_g1_i1.p2 TRINITY_DN4049_c0_g1~~TRINITY_DN4049_c0_g1_i1.p2  ORF type:complete len:129 (+),score=14.35 TRINITY_DN4049_c0_g1_i1:159-545(+)
MSAASSSATPDNTIIKVSSKTSPHGQLGQKYLACGKSLSMRLWENAPASQTLDPVTSRDYETIGYVISGRAELHFSDNQMILLTPGDSWVVPKGAVHGYKILEPFTAVEATHPPAEFHNRDSVNKDKK